MPLSYQKRPAPPVDIHMEVKQLRGEKKQWREESERLRSALDEVGLQKERLESALEECMDLLLQVNDKKDREKEREGRRASCSVLSGSDMADFEKEELRKQSEHLSKQKEDLEEVLTCADMKLQQYSEREVLLTTEIDQLRSEAKLMAKTNEDLRTKVINIEKRFALKDEEIIEARVNAAKAAADLTEERKTREEISVKYKLLEERVRAFHSIPSQQPVQDIQGLMSDTARIRTQMQERQQTFRPSPKEDGRWSLSPEEHTPPPRLRSPLHDINFNTSPSTPIGRLGVPSLNTATSPQPRARAALQAAGLLNASVEAF